MKAVNLATVVRILSNCTVGLYTNVSEYTIELMIRCQEGYRIDRFSVKWSRSMTRNCHLPSIYDGRTIAGKILVRLPSVTDYRFLQILRYTRRN